MNNVSSVNKRTTVLCSENLLSCTCQCTAYLLLRRPQSVCVSVCLREDLRNHTRDLYQFFVRVAYVCGSVFSGMLTVGRIACRREEGNGSAQRGRSVIYVCLVENEFFISEETMAKLIFYRQDVQIYIFLM